MTSGDNGVNLFPILERVNGFGPPESRRPFVNYFPGRGTVMERAYLEGEAQGEAKGEANAILRFLEARGISVSEEARDRIAGCTDLDLLNRWLDRTPHVESVDDLFAEDPEATVDHGGA